MSSITFKGKTLAEVQAMANYPWGLGNSGCGVNGIRTSNDASQEWFKAELSTAISGLSESSTAADIVAALKSLI